MAALRLPPAMAVVLSVAALAVAPAPAVAVGDCTPDAAWPAARPDLAAQVVALVNAHREQIGLAPLAVSPTLTAAATWKARHMAAYHYMAHDDPAPPVARTTAERIAACGYPTANWGENIAYGYPTAQAVVDGWLSSPEHRANIERADVRATGVGVAGSPLYWAQTFGSVVDAGSSGELSAPDVQAPAAPAPAAAPAPLAISVSCAGHPRAVSCRVRGARGAVVRLALVRSGHVLARARADAHADVIRMRLQPRGRLRPGRYAVVVRAIAPSATRKGKLRVTVR
jgi:uncharacterized protein YkwD